MIQVNKDYTIHTSPSGYVVKYDLHIRVAKMDIRTGEFDKNPCFDTVGCFDSLTGAIKGIIEDMNRRALSAETYTLEEAIEIVRENNKRVYKLLEKVLEI